MPPGLKIDWFRVLVQLRDKGFPVLDVADQTDIPRTTLIDMQNGAEPRHANGERLLEFWAAATGQCRDDAPLTSDFPSAHKRRH
jgi:hypothetical protein